MLRKIFVALAGLFLSLSVAHAAETCSIAWSRYTGWEPWGYIAQAPFKAKWEQKTGTKVSITYVGDYIESINQYTNGAFDGVTATTIDALTLPAVSGKDSTVLILGDYSNGNDAIVVKDSAGAFRSVKDLKGKEVSLVQFSVSDYLLQRALDIYGMSARDITMVNTSDADIGAQFLTAPEGTVVVTWNPIVMTILKEPGAKVLFSSAQIPEEIMDVLLVRSDLSASCKKALRGMWYEAMAIMADPKHPKHREMLAFTAQQASGGAMAEKEAVAWFAAQLRTTRMFYTPEEANKALVSAKLKATMDHIRRFAFERGLFPEGALSADVVGIAFPDGSVLGDSQNVKLRFVLSK